MLHLKANFESKPEYVSLQLELIFIHLHVLKNSVHQCDQLFFLAKVHWGKYFQGSRGVRTQISF